MSTGRIEIDVPQSLADFTAAGPLREALIEFARLADSDLSLSAPCALPRAEERPGNGHALPLRSEHGALGRVRFDGNGRGDRVDVAARGVALVLEHLLERETAVADLAEAMLGNYEELNMLYSLLPGVAARVHGGDIGQLLVEEAARMLNCRRVSLLVLDENREFLRVLASKGLPPDAANVLIPVRGSIAGRVFRQDGLLVVNDLSEFPDICAQSAGQYDADSFAVARVPLVARGEPLGVLSATDRAGSPEFTARDRKLLEGLSAVSASALLNCRLHAQVKRQMISTIRALASAVDAKDHYTHDHSSRVAQYCVATARQLGVDDNTMLHKVELAGLLHDIGKIGIPDAILGKCGRLTAEEFGTVRQHVEIGARIVRHVRDLNDVADAILHHHERYDGLGYPDELVGEDIPFISRLIAVADVYDTLTTDRPYRPAVSVQDAVCELKRCAGAHFDRAVVGAFLAVLEGEETLQRTPLPTDAAV